MNEAFDGLPADAATLYRGNVMHARLKPVGHRFVYRVLNLLIDLDRLPEADRQSRLFGVNRRALYAFHERDHGPRDGTSLAAYVRDVAAGEGVDLTGGRIWLLCYPRLLGFVFNPLSIYYGYAQRRQACAPDLRGPQHLRRDSQLCLPGAAGRDQPGRAFGRSATSDSMSRPSSAWTCATIST